MTEPKAKRIVVKTKYQPLDYDSGELVLDYSKAIVQAAQQLDRAGEFAAKTFDVAAMMEVAKGWLALGSALMVEDDEDETSGDESEGKKKFTGFHNPVKKTEEDKDEDAK